MISAINRWKYNSAWMPYRICPSECGGQGWFNAICKEKRDFMHCRINRCIGHKPITFPNRINLSAGVVKYQLVSVCQGDFGDQADSRWHYEYYYAEEITENHQHGI